MTPGVVCVRLQVCRGSAEKRNAASPADYVVLVSCVICIVALQCAQVFVQVGGCWVHRCSERSALCAGTVKNGHTQLQKNTQSYTQVYSARRRTCSCAHQMPALEIEKHVINQQLLLQQTDVRTHVRKRHSILSTVCLSL